MIAKTLNIRCYGFFSDNKCALFARLGGGGAERAQCDLFTVFLYRGFPKYQYIHVLQKYLSLIIYIYLVYSRRS